MIKLVNIKGSNGSGKTTIVKQLMSLCAENPPEHLSYRDDVVATLMEDIGWAAIGPYSEDKRMGGCDCIPTVQRVKDAIFETVRYCNYHGGYFGVVFEGMMISTIKSTFYDLLLEYLNRDEAQPRIVILRASLEGCLRRITARGSRKPNLNIDNVRNKCEMIIRHAKTYDQSLVRWMDVDDIPEEDMALEFLRAVSDVDLVEMMKFVGVIKQWRKAKNRQ